MIRGTKRPMPKQQTLDFQASIHNRFDIEVLDAKTGKLKQRARAFNVICDALWNQMFRSTSGWWLTNPRYFDRIMYGRGTGTPSASDTELFDLISAVYPGNESSWSQNAIEVTADFEKCVATAQASIILQAEIDVGETITEVGIGYDATHCVTHAMLEDMNGNPISIVKTETDVIKIYATLFLHWPASAWYAGTVNLVARNDVNFNPYEASIIRQLLGCRSTAYTLWRFGIYEVSEAVKDYNVVSIKGGSVTVDTANKKVSGAIRIPATSGNMPIRYINVALLYGSSTSDPGTLNSHQLCVYLGNWYTPQQITGEAIGTGDGTTKDFKTAFPIRSLSAVKVNGVSTTVTSRSGPPDGTQTAWWFNTVLCMMDSGYPVRNTVLGSATGRWSAGSLAAQGYSPAAENPFHAVGVGSIGVSFDFASYAYQQIAVEASDDAENWEEVGRTPRAQHSSSNEVVWIEVPAALQNKKYFRLRNLADVSNYSYSIYATVPGSAPAYNIHFEVPPAAGAVITADYVPDCIAKDENHVFDLTLELMLGEYQEG